MICRSCGLKVDGVPCEVCGYCLTEDLYGCEECDKRKGCQNYIDALRLEGILAESEKKESLVSRVLRKMRVRR